MSDTYQTQQRYNHPNDKPGVSAEYVCTLERENTTLRAHAEQLAEALEELIKVLRKEARGTPLNHHRFDQLGIDCNNAITTYRADHPKK